MGRIRIASIRDIPEGTGREVPVGRMSVAVWNIGGRFYATGARCPHEDAPLCAGSLDGTVVTCPMHGWQFDVRSGEGVNPPHSHLRPFPLHVEGEDLYIELGS